MNPSLRHNSWKTKDGSLYLLGGDYGEKTTTKVTDENSDTDKGFKLSYETE